MAVENLTRGERTRLAILEAAHGLFVENGYGGTSMRQIAERAEMAVGGIYNHFSSKEDILRRLVAARSPFPKIRATLEEAEGTSGPELLANALRRIVAIAVDNIDFIQLAYIDIQQFDGAAMLEVMGDVLPTALAFGQRVIEAGGLRPDVSAYTVMRTFASLMIGFALTERIAFTEGQPRLDILPDMGREAWLDALADVYLHGVAQGAEG